MERDFLEVESKGYRSMRGKKIGKKGERHEWKETFLKWKAKAIDL